jgi:uncharacterized cupredoxin-like copper-binding protein
MARPCRLLAGLTAALAAAALPAACSGGGGSYKEPSGPAVATLRFHSGNLFFKPSKVSSPAGIVKIEVQNDSGAHTFNLHEVKGFEIDLSGDGGSKKVQLTAGKQYHFYCSIPGHEAAGMKGTITAR